MSELNGSGAPSSEEVSRALRRCWQPLARVEDLAAGPQRVVLLEEPLAVFLTEGGRPAVVVDRCPHRGASLSMGRVRGESIQCPYHGWEWGADGACTRVPALEDQRQIPPGACVTTYPAKVHWGLVWSVLEEPLTDIPDVSWFDPEEWTWGIGTPFELPVGLGLMIENFRDIAHFAFVHRKTLGAITEIVEPLRVEREGYRLRMRRPITIGADSDPAWESLRELENDVIAPNFTSARMFTAKGPERGLLHAARAVSATESVHYWIEAFDRNFSEFNLEEAIAAEELVYAEDLAILSGVRPRELPLTLDGQISTLADSLTISYRRAFADYVTEALAAGDSQPEETVSGSA